MQVHFTPELEAKLAHSAAQQGRNPDQLVQEVVARYFDEESRFIDAVTARKHYSTASTSRMSKWESACNGSCGPDGNPLVPPGGRGFRAHLRMD
jgi:hypothetical protein